MKLLFLGNDEDQPYLHALKGAVRGNACSVILKPVSTVTEALLLAKAKGAEAIITTQLPLLRKLAQYEKPSIDNYAGSLFHRDGIEIVIVDPLKQTQTLAWGKFLLARNVSKLVAKEEWMPDAEFSYTRVTESNVAQLYAEFSTAIAIAADIETFSTPLAIRCIGYTGIFSTGTKFFYKTIVLPITSEFFLTWMRKFNDLPIDKVFQNGKYDIAYLARFNAVPVQYYWDTAHMFHSTYSELPKDLGFLGAFYVRNTQYWKDLAETNDLSEYYRYCGLDTWTTAQAFIAWMATAPEYARRNYLLEFSVVPACHMAELTGYDRDPERLKEQQDKYNAKIVKDTDSLQRMVGYKGFNANSPKQVLRLLHILGHRDIDSTEEKYLKKAAYLHPMSGLFVEKILEIRGDRKLVGTYLKDDTVLAGTNKILYVLNPHGTDTGRLASKEHHFWCGWNTQNPPRGSSVKRTIVAPDGWLFAEVDLEQAESRDTGYISGDERLIEAVTGTRDFHSVNASAFFGFPYQDIYDDEKRKTKNKTLRDLAKRVNHGANYNMGPGVLVDTMGLKAIYEAKKLLGLPQSMGPIDVAEELLARFHRTYPGIAGNMYSGVLRDISLTKMITGATGWTRYCFKDPTKNKRDKNAYVAHPPQSLNALVLNKAFNRCFHELAIAPEHKNNFRMIAQIHDSIFFRFRIGMHFYCDEVKKRMEVPVTVKGYDGKVRTFIVPAAIKAGPEGKGAKYWDETE